MYATVVHDMVWSTSPRKKTAYEYKDCRCNNTFILFKKFKEIISIEEIVLIENKKATSKIIKRVE